MSSSTPFPSGSISSVSGTTVVVRGDDIDTDRIIPARFLKCVTFDALGPAVRLANTRLIDPSTRVRRSCW
jgi:3-isopropylmalate dehydratase small subunit